MSQGPFVAILDDRPCGPAETLIGNAIAWHRPTRRSRLAVWRYRHRLGGCYELTCRYCGAVVGFEGFHYHQAQAAIALLRENP